MNKLLFHEGGQPLHLDDLEYLQASLSAPLSSIISAWGDCVLSGCDITLNKETSVYASTAGYIAFRGVVYQAQAATFEQLDPADIFYWVFSSAEGGTKTFADGEEHPTRVQHTARLLASRDTPEAGLYISDRSLPRLGVHIARRPMVRCTSEDVDVLDFTETSAYSGMLTIRLPQDYTLSGSFGSVAFNPRLNNTFGQGIVPQMGEPNQSTDRVIHLIDGRLYARQTGESTGSRRSGGDIVSIPISWDYGKPEVSEKDRKRMFERPVRR